MAASRRSASEGPAPPFSQSQTTVTLDCLSPVSQDEPLAAIASNHRPEQPTVSELAKYGIKVRDFAYESTLPPIAPVYLLPKQIQPDPGILRLGDQLPTSQANDSKKVERYTTERPIPSFGVIRRRGFSDLRQYDADNDELPDSQDSSYMLSLPPPSYTHESEEYVKTPIVTPNGSLQWQGIDDNELPASQLDGCTPFLPVSFSQTPTRGEHRNKDSALGTPSPLSSAHSSFCISPSPMPGSKSLLPKHRLRRRSSRNITPRLSRSAKGSTPPGPIPPASRYYLRKRPSSNAMPPSASRPCTRSRLRPTALSPLSNARQPITVSTTNDAAPSRSFRKRPTTTTATKGNGNRL